MLTSKPRGTEERRGGGACCLSTAVFLESLPASSNLCPGNLFIPLLLPWWCFFEIDSWWRIFLQWGRPWFNSWVRKIPWRRDRLPTPVFLGFLAGSDGIESTCSVRDLGRSLGSEDSLERGLATDSSILAWRIPTDRGAWQSVHGITKSWTWLSNCAHSKTAEFFQRLKRFHLLLFLTDAFKTQG